MQLSIAVSNLRRLRSTPPIPLRPITILVGKNSAGKSTFLRTFPLIRQSLETKSSAPILWYGDYVDFGNFGTAVSDKNRENKITLSFKLENYEYDVDNKTATSSSFNFYRSSPIKHSFKEIDIKLTIGERKNKTVLEKISIISKDRDINLQISEDSEFEIFSKGTINEESIQKLIHPFHLMFFNDRLLMTPVLVRRIENEENRFRLSYVDNHRVFQSSIQKILKRNIFDGRIKDETIRKESERILKEQSFNNNSLQRLEKTKTEKFKNLYRKMREGHYQNERKNIESIIKLRESLYGYTSICKSLSSFFESCDYIGPARARSERYYREQELEVSDISPDGKNLPMFLASLQEYQRQEFSNWVEKVFGFGIKILTTPGHISIELTENNQRINVADTGYGISQVLPVLAQTWWKQQPNAGAFYKQNDSNLNANAIVIEQPELHLHPAHQALLADVFAQSTSRSQNDSDKKDTILIIETHSEALINRLGELIDDGIVAHEDVQIIVFDESSDFGLSDQISSSVSTATFDSDGTLKNWPFGFFDYE